MVLGNTGRGGSQSYAMNLLRHIDREIFDIDFAVYEDKSNGYGEEIRKRGSKIHIVPRFNGFNYISCRKVWKKIYKCNHYDIIHGHATNAAFIYLKVARKLRIKTIIHSHSAGFRGNYIERLIKPIFSYFGRRYADFWFACSEKAAVKLYGDQHHKYPYYYCIPNAIDVSKYKFNPAVRKKIRAKYGIQDNILLIGHIGSFSGPKNHKFLIDIFYHLTHTNVSTNLMLCGDGPLQKEIIQKIKNLGLSSKVILTGNIPNVEEYLMAMDILVFPSIFEGLPVSIVEAQATGLPVILSDTITNEVAITDLLKNLSLNNGVETWSSAINTTNLIHNREKYNRIVLNSIFSMTDCIKEMQRLYHQLATDHKDNYK